MVDKYRENHPLLRDELSEEEGHLVSPRFQRRFRSMGCRGHARNNVKGAAAIIRRWPGYWSSVFIYLWIGLGMAVLMILIIYNSVAVFAMLPQIRINQDMALKSGEMNLNQKTSLPEIYMHIIVDPEEELDLKLYLPYIESLTYKYSHYNYNVIVVYNDTTFDMISHENAETINQDALKNILSEKDVYLKTRRTFKNLIIKHTSLTSYMNNSPLRKHWKTLPSHYMEFLIRAISIWEKGGVAFDPILLTPRSPQAAYIEKIYSILKKFDVNIKNNPQPFHSIGTQERENNSKTKKRVNNIRDIIEALENEDEFSSSQENLTAAEDIQYDMHVGRKLFSISSNESTEEHNISKLHIVHSLSSKSNGNKEKDITQHSKMPLVGLNSSTIVIDKLGINSTSNLNFIPSFLKFIFDMTPKKAGKDENKNIHQYKNIPEISLLALPDQNLNESTSDNVDKPSNYIAYQPPVLKADSVIDSKENSVSDDKKLSDISSGQLVIDLKGNIIATGTACHAFIGSVFSNVVHHADDKIITDFIIRELSIFCKGHLSICKGVDVLFV